MQGSFPHRKEAACAAGTVEFAAGAGVATTGGGTVEFAAGTTVVTATAGGRVVAAGTEVTTTAGGRVVAAGTEATTPGGGRVVAAGRTVGAGGSEKLAPVPRNDNGGLDLPFGVILKLVHTYAHLVEYMHEHIFRWRWGGGGEGVLDGDLCPALRFPIYFSNLQERSLQNNTIPMFY